MSTPHSLTLLFRRDPSKDKRDDRVAYEGYQALWPDGRPVALGLDALCNKGQRLLGLGRKLSGQRERLVDLVRYSLEDENETIHRMPGHRVRRFFVERQGDLGRLHFFDGTPTTMVFDVHRDETAVLEWLGLLELDDGERHWFDLAARIAESDALLQTANGR